MTKRDAVWSSTEPYGAEEERESESDAQVLTVEVGPVRH